MYNGFDHNEMIKRFCENLICDNSKNKINLSFEKGPIKFKTTQKILRSFIPFCMDLILDL
jgi:hypothetical protein